MRLFPGGGAVHGKIGTFTDEVHMGRRRLLGAVGMRFGGAGQGEADAQGGSRGQQRSHRHGGRHADRLAGV
ncbi:hypothetical protein P4H66_28790 [Paenibacillus dokdonensis]|uniref:Uncharacterized protein n=1 Tax=Paenibacillus dokdonensis TaxID=2567944 RepID=A0ABU6GVQ3_9BACL|nr:hypothetical protein [Paenibacillus dokdonensis]MEC0243812.1 hypothetical protein [Paenibacillus dokdonensis]